MGFEKLAKYTSIGCYPLFYVAFAPQLRTTMCLCAACAKTEQNEEGVESVKAEVNWKDPDLFCESCDVRIESAYAEDQVQS